MINVKGLMSTVTTLRSQDREAMVCTFWPYRKYDKYLFDHLLLAHRMRSSWSLHYVEIRLIVSSLSPSQSFVFKFKLHQTWLSMSGLKLQRESCL